MKFGIKLDSDELYCVTKKKHILLINPFICSFFFLCNKNFNFFSVKDFSAATRLRILKFSKKFDSDELYFVTKNSHIFLIIPFICSFFFLSKELFLAKISQQLLDLRFSNLVQSLIVMSCIV